MNSGRGRRPRSSNSRRPCSSTAAPAAAAGAVSAAAAAAVPAGAAAAVAAAAATAVPCSSSRCPCSSRAAEPPELPSRPSHRAAVAAESPEAPLPPSRCCCRVAGTAEPPSRFVRYNLSLRSRPRSCWRASVLLARPGRAIDFDVWVDDLQLFLQCDRVDGLSLFDLTSGASPASAADADATVRSQWATRDAAARLAVRRHLPTSERAHFSQYKSDKTLYDAVVARYSSPATAALSRLILPYLFPDLAAFPTVADLITHLRTSDIRYHAALPAEFCAKNTPPLSEKSIVAVGASRGDPRAPVFEGCSPSPLLPSIASAAAADLVGLESVGAASTPSRRRRPGKGKGVRGAGGTSGGGGGGDGGGGGGGGGCGGGGGGGGVGGGTGGRGGGGGGGGSGGGSGGGGGGGGGGGAGRGGAAQRVGFGGGQPQQQQQQQQRTREIPPPSAAS
ncbi:unnamed protein product [Closterium sp. NIES-64]|nr:unnamed protein product [Closterium sp. NIES-64]